MTGHEKRAAQIEKRIIEVSVQLFDIYGIKKVSIDEIAEKADVSKVTIYKYFGNKKGLIDTVIHLIYRTRMNAMEEILNKDIEFIEKLNFLINIKNDSIKLLKGRFLKEILKENSNPYENETKELFIRFFEEGKKENYIDPTIPNEVLIAYFNIFRAGLESNEGILSSISNHHDTFDRMISLFFHGFIRNK